MIIDKEHKDGKHKHTDSGHHHTTRDDRVKHGTQCDHGDNYSASYTTSTATSSTGYASISYTYSSIRKINDDVPSSRKGRKVRPKNMYTSFNIHIY